MPDELSAEREAPYAWLAGEAGALAVQGRAAMGWQEQALVEEGESVGGMQLLGEVEERDMRLEAQQAMGRMRALRGALMGATSSLGCAAE